MMSQLHLVLEFLSLLLYRIFLVFHSCILLFYVHNYNVIVYLNLIKLYVYIFNVNHQEATSLLWWCTHT